MKLARSMKSAMREEIKAAKGCHEDDDDDDDDRSAARRAARTRRTRGKRCSKPRR